VATATLLLSAGAVGATVEGIGPFASENENATLLFLQLFTGVVAITALAVCSTVSESRRAEQDLRRRSAELRRSNEELEEYAMVASHDLQEPLRMTASYLQLLERRCAERLAPAERGHLHQALEGTGRMRDLIDGLLAYSRVDSGESFVPVDCEVALGHALENLRAASIEAGATITRGPLPVVNGDATQLAQVFQNLVGNALKFRRPGLPVHIGIEAHLSDGQWVFSVSDDGIGIEPAARERVFQLFQRLHHRDEYPGTGVGLAICKKIVARHGGRIWIHSRPEGGSIVSFSLPAGLKPS
jgi:light-regulated signal transduction histidine kinase (bacteriophytochrome)